MKKENYEKILEKEIANRKEFMEYFDRRRLNTKYSIVNGEVVEMPVNKRRFMMGNALVVNLIKDMEVTLEKIFDREES